LAGLHHADRAKATGIKVRRKTAQDRVGILIPFIHKGGEVALSIEHGPPFRFSCNEVGRGGSAAPP
jgi:hypothetical protein